MRTKKKHICYEGHKQFYRKMHWLIKTLQFASFIMNHIIDLAVKIDQI